MKKAIILILMSFCLSLAQSQKIEIRVISPGLKETDTVFISGNNPKLGEWDPSSVPLIKLSDSLWAKEFVFEKGEALEFKFTLGNWENEALDSADKIPGNNKLNVADDTILYFHVSKWSKGIARNITGQITGKVEYYKDYKGKNINSRDIIVWLPPSYNIGQHKRYPVLYMHDGQNIVDPKTSAWGVDWQIDEAADSLIKNNEINEIIIVGIYNTPNRYAEYSNTDSGYSYMDFIVDELKPFIDSTYKTIPDKENTAVMGSSMGGLISFMMVWEYSDVFSKAGCFSPAFHLGNLNYIPAVESYSGPKKEITLYIDLGGIGVEEKLLPGTEEMIKVLESKGYLEGSDLFFVLDKNAKHDEAAWAKRVHFPLKLFFGKRQ